MIEHLVSIMPNSEMVTLSQIMFFTHRLLIINVNNRIRLSNSTTQFDQRRPTLSPSMYQMKKITGILINEPKNLSTKMLSLNLCWLKRKSAVNSFVTSKNENNIIIWNSVDRLTKSRIRSNRCTPLSSTVKLELSSPIVPSLSIWIDGDFTTVLGSVEVTPLIFCFCFSSSFCLKSPK